MLFFVTITLYQSNDFTSSSTLFYNQLMMKQNYKLINGGATWKNMKILLSVLVKVAKH